MRELLGNAAPRHLVVWAVGDKKFATALDNLYAEGWELTHLLDVH